MKRSLLALALMMVPAAAAPGDAALYALYADGHYEEAMREGGRGTQRHRLCHRGAGGAGASGAA